MSEVATYVCPKCKSTDDFKISGAIETYSAAVFLDGFGEVSEVKSYDGGTDWEDDCDMECRKCNHSGLVGDFERK